MSSKTETPRQSRYRFSVIRCPESPYVSPYVPVGSYADSVQPPAAASEPEKVGAPKGNSYADIMASKPKGILKGILKKGKVPSAQGTERENKGDSEVSELCLKMSSVALSATSPKPRKSPSIESIHSPKTAQKSPDKKVPAPMTDEKAVSAQKTDEKPVASPQESVLSPPTEVKVNKMYGGWKGLKGDPAKLERLNQPRTKPLESRWAS